MVVARALATRTGHRIRESPVDREVLQRRGPDLLRRGMRERPQDVPEQHVAREVVRLSQRIVGRCLGRRHKTECRPASEEPVQRGTARVAVTLAHHVLSGQPSVIRDEQKGVKLLVELERDVLGLARSERGAWPRAVGPLRNLEKPGDESVHGGASAGLPRCGRQKRAADVVGVARPNKRQDLVVGDDRYDVLADARGRAVERVRDAATDLVSGLAVQPETGPQRSSRAHLVGGEPSPVFRDGASFGERRLKVAAQCDCEDELRRSALADLDRRRQYDGDRSVEHAVVDPQHRPITTRDGRDRRMRDRAPFGDLGVVGPTEARPSAPVRYDDAGLWTSRDADELRETCPEGRRDRPHFDPSVLVLVHPMRDGVLFEEGSGCDIEERQPERRTIARG